MEERIVENAKFFALVIAWATPSEIDENRPMRDYQSELGITLCELHRADNIYEVIYAASGNVSQGREIPYICNILIFRDFCCRLPSQLAETRTGGWFALHWDE